MMTVMLDAFRSGMQWLDQPDFAPGTVTPLPPADYNLIYPKAPGGDRVARVARNQTHVDILMYIMHHYPGNTVKSWKRQLFGDLSHGTTHIDLFLFETSLMGYTCDYVDADGGAYPGTRAALNQVGLFEDIIQAGVVNAPGGVAVAILYSETTETWRQAEGPVDKKTGARLDPHCCIGQCIGQKSCSQCCCIPAPALVSSIGRAGESCRAVAAA